MFFFNSTRDNKAQSPISFTGRVCVLNPYGTWENAEIPSLKSLNSVLAERFTQGKSTSTYTFSSITTDKDNAEYSNKLVFTAPESFFNQSILREHTTPADVILVAIPAEFLSYEALPNGVSGTLRNIASSYLSERIPTNVRIVIDYSTQSTPHNAGAVEEFVEKVKALEYAKLVTHVDCINANQDKMIAITDLGRSTTTTPEAVDFRAYAQILVKAAKSDTPEKPLNESDREILTAELEVRRQIQQERPKRFEAETTASLSSTSTESLSAAEASSSNSHAPGEIDTASVAAGLAAVQFVNSPLLSNRHNKTPTGRNHQNAIKRAARDLFDKYIEKHFPNYLRDSLELLADNQRLVAALYAIDTVLDLVNANIQNADTANSQSFTKSQIIDIVYQGWHLSNWFEEGKSFRDSYTKTYFGVSRHEVKARTLDNEHIAGALTSPGSTPADTTLTIN